MVPASTACLLTQEKGPMHYCIGPFFIKKIFLFSILFYQILIG